MRSSFVHTTQLVVSLLRRAYRSYLYLWSILEIANNLYIQWDGIEMRFMAGMKQGVVKEMVYYAFRIKSVS